MQSKTFKAKIVRDGSACFIPLTFDPKAVFGKIRAPVKVTLNGYTYRSTIAAMGGPPCIPLRRSNREAAGLEGGETLDVRLDLDTEERVVKPPADLVKALKASSAWDALEGSELLAPARARRGDRRGQEARDTRASNRAGGADGSVQEMKRDFLVRLKFGSAAWNIWRQENPDVAIVLDGATLNGMILTGVNFSGVSLRRASLHATNLMNADLRGADLTGANLVEADLIGAQLHGAVLTGANLHEADLLGADPATRNAHWTI